MSQNQIVQARVNAEIKTQATAVLAAMGLSVSDAVRMLLTRVARDKTMPAELLVSDKTTLEAMKDAREGRVESVTLDDIRAAIRENS